MADYLPLANLPTCKFAPCPFFIHFIQLIHSAYFIVMKTNHLIIISLLFAALGFTNCDRHEAAETETTAADAEALKRASVSRGEYLVNVMGCDDCHTPKTMTPQGPAPDLTRRFMGHPANEPFESADKKNLIETQHVAVFSPGMTAAAGPWGVSFAANISPDDTGIGTWTEAQFFKAIREGKSKGLDGTRPLLPPMPWPTLAKLTDEDLRAIFNYLKTVTPMKNIVPQPKGL